MRKEIPVDKAVFIKECLKYYVIRWVLNNTEEHIFTIENIFHVHIF